MVTHQQTYLFQAHLGRVPSLAPLLQQAAVVVERAKLAPTVVCLAAAAAAAAIKTLETVVLATLHLQVRHKGVLAAAVQGRLSLRAMALVVEGELLLLAGTVPAAAVQESGATAQLPAFLVRLSLMLAVVAVVIVRVLRREEPAAAEVGEPQLGRCLQLLAQSTLAVEVVAGVTLGLLQAAQAALAS